MAITKFTKKNLDAVRAEIEAALLPVLEKHGLSSDLGNISYSDDFFRATLQVNVGSQEEAEKTKFAKDAPLFDLTPEDYGRKFSNDGEEFTLYGFTLKSPKYPVKARSASGESYKFREDVLKRLAD